MRRATILSAFALFALAGCGQHYQLVLSEVSASRGLDDVVHVNATVTCVEVGVACAPPCVEAAWFPRAALVSEPIETTVTELRFDAHAEFEGDPVRTRSACAPAAPADDDEVTVALSSEEAAPAGDMLIEVRIQNSQGGSSTDLQRVLIQP